MVLFNIYYENSSKTHHQLALKTLVLSSLEVNLKYDGIVISVAIATKVNYYKVFEVPLTIFQKLHLPKLLSSFCCKYIK